MYHPNGNFLGLSLHAQWWVVAYYFSFLIILNILGEELWWRAYILPRQEIAHGSSAWVLNGVLWEGFHIFLHSTLFSFFVALPGALLLAFVAQKSKSTWPGIIGHAVMNYGLPLAILTRVLGRCAKRADEPGE